MFDALISGFMMLMDPYRMLLLWLGVTVGLAIGILPGIGGLVGLALLLPFTFGMDAYAAFALLLGLMAVTSVSDTIPAVLFGVPGTSASQATVLDGLPMAKKGEAGRALAAAYTSSLIGGLCGAALMAITLPLLRPIMLYIGSPELLSLAVFGISSVAVLSGSTPLRGLVAGCFGVMLAMIGSDPQTGTLRWTLDSLYLWEGLPLVPAVLGLFALPELADLAIQRTSITKEMKFNPREGMLRGAKDAIQNWWLILRCSWIGAFFGAIPGIGSSVIDWLAYGHALRTVKGANKTFGKGDVRGVIAPESATNSKDGGALVPTIVFGVPGSAGMAILLGAFMIHGLVPGPDMITKNLDVTYSMVWSLAFANIVGAGLCFAFSGYMAKLATLRYTLILPGILTITYVGSFQSTRNWGDLYVLLIFGLLGWVMKQLKWPRPPLILGMILGSIIERYLFISIQRYGIDWFARPVVIFFFAISFLAIFRPFLADVKAQGGLRNMLKGYGQPVLRAPALFYVFLLGLMTIMLWDASSWNFSAKIVPMVVGVMGIILGIISLMNYSMFYPERRPKVGTGEERLHMDLQTDHSALPVRETIRRAAVFFGWLVGFMASMAVIGLIPTVPLFVIAFMRVEGREPWKITLPMAFVLTIAIYIVFDQLLTIPWPPTYLGDWVPALKAYIPSI